MSKTEPQAEPVSESSSQPAAKKTGLRKNGKQWHTQKKAFRPTAGMTAYAQRKMRDEEKASTKALEREMREQKEAQHNKRVEAIKARRQLKADKERYDKMAEKMHQKRVDRRRRREKRNKLLNS